ncbi:MAG: sugar ABC transporter substrate-binding protein [Clostridia bacterium]|nr:sugar ABC transporter substrate-binding protein [Clostridia bacterium]
MKSKRIFALVLVVLVALASVACSAAPAPAGGAPAEAAKFVGDTNVAYNPEIQEDGVKRLGICYSALTYSASQLLVKNYEKLYKDYGFDEIISLSADGDLETQISQIQDLVNQKCDVIVINSIDANGIASVCDMAMQAGVAVMAVDRKIGTSIYYTLETDNVSAGRDCAMTVADWTFAPGIADDAVHVMYVIGDMSSSAQYDRLEGVKGTLAFYPWIDVVATPSALETSEVYDAVIDAFTADPTIKAVFVTGGDDSVTPVVSALRELGKLYDPQDPNYVYIASVDGALNAIEAIEAGESFCTANQRFDLFCTQILEVAQNYMNGEYVSPNANTVQLSCSMVMRETVDNLEELGVLWARGWFAEAK